jgi:hypothetical protein
MLNLAPAEIRALVAFAKGQGKDWQTALKQSWETGVYPGASEESIPHLQAVREKFGPAKLWWVEDAVMEPLAALADEGISAEEEIRLIKVIADAHDFEIEENEADESGVTHPFTIYWRNGYGRHAVYCNDLPDLRAKYTELCVDFDDSDVEDDGGGSLMKYLIDPDF